MALEVRPEPADEVRAAIAQALRAADREPGGGRWWRAGLAESVQDDPAFDQAVARPRRRLGAARA